MQLLETRWYLSFLFTLISCNQKQQKLSTININLLVSDIDSFKPNKFAYYTCSKGTSVYISFSTFRSEYHFKLLPLYVISCWHEQGCGETLKIFHFLLSLLCLSSYINFLILFNKMIVPPCTYIAFDLFYIWGLERCHHLPRGQRPAATNTFYLFHVRYCWIIRPLLVTHFQKWRLYNLL